MATRFSFNFYFPKRIFYSIKWKKLTSPNMTLTTTYFFTSSWWIYGLSNPFLKKKLENFNCLYAPEECQTKSARALALAERERTGSLIQFQ